MGRYIFNMGSSCHPVQRKQIVKEIVYPSMIAVFNIDNISEPTSIILPDKISDIKSIEIDGILLDEVVSQYQFTTTGNHTIKIEYYSDNSFLYGEKVTDLTVETVPDLSLYTSLSKLTVTGNKPFNNPLPPNIVTLTLTYPEKVQLNISMNFLKRSESLAIYVPADLLREYRKDPNWGLYIDYIYKIQ